MKRNSLLLIFLSVNLFSQLYPTNQELTSRFNSRVKLLDEFINRFNNLEQNNEIKNFSKQSQFAFLFNLENKDLITKQDSKDFVFKVSNDSFNQKLSFYDSNFFVCVNSIFLVNQVEKSIRFILKIRVSDKGYAWVINKIYPIDTFKIDSFSNFNPRLYIPISPVDNEVGFIQFSELLKGKKITKQNFSNNIDSNSTLQYLNFINSPISIFKEITNVQYHFFQIDQFHFTVDFFRRPSNNSGWLISNLSKMNDSQKNELINNLFK